MPYFGHKVVPHAQLWWNELLPVCRSLGGHRRWGGWGLFYRASRNKHPHVEPTSVSVHILRWGLSGSHWGGGKNKEMVSSNTMNSDKVNLQQTAVCYTFVTFVQMMSVILKAKEGQEIDKDRFGGGSELHTHATQNTVYSTSTST